MDSFFERGGLSRGASPSDGAALGGSFKGAQLLRNFLMLCLPAFESLLFVAPRYDPLSPAVVPAMLSWMVDCARA